MTRPYPSRRLIVTADDFGYSASINLAVLRAHREGILTSASLMVNGASVDQAVALARASPRLGVGLHLTLMDGLSTLPPERIPGLVDAEREFTNNLAGAELQYFFRRDWRAQLRAEIHAQFRKFRATGLPLDHVNGHHHLHLHPTVFRILMDDAAQLGIERLRLPVDPFWLNARLASGRWGYRALYAAVYRVVATCARPALRRRGIRHTGRVFGLLQTAHVDETYLVRLLPHLPPGDSELYAHPSLEASRNELEAMVSPRVRDQVTRLGIRLIRYQDL